MNLLDAKSVVSPGTNDEETDTKEGARMDKQDSNSYRRAAARLNYLSLDRPDISFASKEASRHMANPREGNEVLIKRNVR